MRTATSFATKLSGIGTATQPASTMAKYAVTACTFMGISIAMASPFLNPSASRAFATRLHVKLHMRSRTKTGERKEGRKKGRKKREAMSYLTLARNCESVSCWTGRSSSPSLRCTTAMLESDLAPFAARQHSAAFKRAPGTHSPLLASRKQRHRWWNTTLCSSHRSGKYCCHNVENQLISFPNRPSTENQGKRLGQRSSTSGCSQDHR
jgi:hypothetical protein